MPAQYDFGMIGLGTMGSNLVFNMCDHGYIVAGYDKDKTKVDALTKNGNGKAQGIPVLTDFINSLKSPKVILLLVPAGKIVDAVLGEIMPLLKTGDIVMDCGNSHYTDTDRRIAELKTTRIQFMGVGISGGEEGARKGPSIMPGGPKDAFERVSEMLKAVSAKVDGEPCVSYIGKGSAGHYVKMVHNGIEYAIMQLLAEAYHIMKLTLEMNNKEIHNVFAEWNKGRLQSYLIEITADIFLQKDELTKENLVDLILDTSKQNGTGKWASQSAMDLFVPIPSIDAAVAARYISSLREERTSAQKIISWHAVEWENSNNELLHWLEEAVYFGSALAYAQGFALMRQASFTFNYELKLADIAHIWRGGCIIRSAFLSDIMRVYQSSPDLPNLLLDNDIALLVQTCQTGARFTAKTGLDSGIPMPVLQSSLAYFDSYRSSQLPANLIQAQRDYFGAHTYERTDRTGIFHTQWTK